MGREPLWANSSRLRETASWHVIGSGQKWAANEIAYSGRVVRSTSSEIGRDNQSLPNRLTAPGERPMRDSLEIMAGPDQCYGQPIGADWLLAFAAEAKKGN